MPETIQTNETLKSLVENSTKEMTREEMFDKIEKMRKQREEERAKERKGGCGCGRN